MFREDGKIALMELSETQPQKEKNIHRTICRDRIMLITLENAIITNSFTLSKRCSNNTAKYEAVIIGLELTLQKPITNLTIYGYF